MPRVHPVRARHAHRGGGVTPRTTEGLASHHARLRAALVARGADEQDRSGDEGGHKGPLGLPAQEGWEAAAAGVPCCLRRKPVGVAGQPTAMWHSGCFAYVPSAPWPKVAGLWRNLLA